MSTDCSILICTHNRGPLLAKTLATVDALTPVPGWAVEVVLIANACTDDTAERAGAWAAATPWPARVIDEPVPGLSRARNRALAESTGTVVAYIDDDVQLDPDWLVALRGAFETTDDAGGRPDVIGGRVDLWWECEEKPAWYRPRMDGLLSLNHPSPARKRLAEPYGLVGANFAFRRAAADSIGGFREDLGRSGAGALGGEESDWLQRAQAAGLAAWYDPSVRLKHWVPKSRVTPEYLKRVSRGNARGRVRMKPRLSPGRWLRALAGHTFLFTRHGLACLACLATGRRDAAVAPALLRETGLGGLIGLADRLRTGGRSAPEPPATPQHP